jgi:hypothetical protein
MDSLIGRIVPVVSEHKRTAITRAYVLYCCRMVDSDPLRAALKDMDPNNGDYLESLKFELDYSTLLNRIWRTAHYASTYDRLTKRVIQEAAEVGDMDEQEASFLIRSLSSEERNSIAVVRTYLRSPYTQAETTHVLERVEGHVKNLVSQRLRYIADNDKSKDRADLEGELRIHALKSVLRYEIEALSYTHMVRLVARSLQNHAINTILRANRDSRKILKRIQVKDSSRVAWWFCPDGFFIRKVTIAIKGNREMVGTRLYCEAKVHARAGKRTRKALVPVDRLYPSRMEAVEARKNERKGIDSARTTFLDLSGKVQDDFSVVAISADKPLNSVNGEEAATLWDFIPCNRYNPGVTCDEFVRRITPQVKSDDTRQFIDIVLGGDNDYFAAWCDKKDLDPATLSPYQLGREACRFLGIPISKVKKDLGATPKEFWRTYGAKQL